MLWVLPTSRKRTNYSSTPTPTREHEVFTSQTKNPDLAFFSYFFCIWHQPGGIILHFFEHFKKSFNTFERRYSPNHTINNTEVHCIQPLNFGRLVSVSAGKPWFKGT